jgi:hypothetical protein
LDYRPIYLTSSTFELLDCSLIHELYAIHQLRIAFVFLLESQALGRQGIMCSQKKIVIDVRWVWPLVCVDDVFAGRNLAIRHK